MYQGSSGRRLSEEDVAPDELPPSIAQSRVSEDVVLSIQTMRFTGSRIEDNVTSDRYVRSRLDDDDIAPDAQPPRPTQIRFDRETELNVQASTTIRSRFDDDDDIAPDVQPSTNTHTRLDMDDASQSTQSRLGQETTFNVQIPEKIRLKLDNGVAPSTGNRDGPHSGGTIKDVRDKPSFLDPTVQNPRPKPKLMISFDGTSVSPARKGSIYESNRQLPRRTPSVAQGSPFPSRAASMLDSPTSSRSASTTLGSPSSMKSESMVLSSPSSRRTGSIAPNSSLLSIDPNDPLSSRKISYTPRRNFSVSGFGGPSSIMRGSVSGPSAGVSAAGRRTSFLRRSDGSPFASRKSFSGFQGFVATRAGRSFSVSGGSTYRSRSRSSSSILYYVRRPKDETLPFLDPESNPELVRQFMDMTREDAGRNQRSKLETYSFIAVVYCGLLCVLYFGLIGWPLWHGIIWHLWRYVSVVSHVNDGFLIFLSWGASITYAPLLFCQFEKNVDDVEKRDASETCLIIPAYKAAGALPATIRHALAIFKPEQIFIIANGNSPTPLDGTADVCRLYGVRHYWVPVGSKITAEFVGVVLAKEYKYVLLIDDDVHLPPDLPLATNRINDKTKCIGYTIQSTGADGAKGTIIQQVQDLEYKLAGISKVFQSTYGSATFPHGAIILWDRNVLEKCFWSHPGFHISEDWYFGHTCRSAGYRIQFCSQVFVETETPPALIIPSKSSRGGYGEMTIYKQRFHRWNFFHMYRLTDDFNYLFFAWRLGWYEIVTKIFVIAEIYDTILYVLRPFLWPMTLISDPKLGFAMIGVITAIYGVGTVAFNAIHLKRKNAMVSWNVFIPYFAMKLAMIFIDTASVYYSLFAYAKFFAKRHPRVTQDRKALEAAQKLIQEAEKNAEVSKAPSLLRKLSVVSTSSTGSSSALLQPASPASTPTLFDWSDSIPFKKGSKEVVVRATEVQHPYLNPHLGVISESQETLVIDETEVDMARASGVEMHPEGTFSAPCVLQEKQYADGWPESPFSSPTFVR